MAELKTKATDASVLKFLSGIKDAQRRKDCLAVAEMMRKATGAEPKMWGSSMVGFGHYHYVYGSGREGDWFLVGFSPRARDLSLYLMGGLAQHATLMKQLGRHKTGKSCLYVNRLDDLHLPTLRKLIAVSAKEARRMHREPAAKKAR